MKTRWICLLTIILLIITLDSVSAQKIEEKDGAKYITNEGKGLWEKDDNVRIEHIGTLGELIGDENFMFFVPEKIIGDWEGNIYVIDSGNHRIQKFDKDLNYIATLGRKGQGPEEFTMPTFMSIDLEGNLSVFDFGNKRITKFTSKGEFINSKRFAHSNCDMKYLENGDILIKNPRLDGNFGYKGRGVSLFHVLDREMNVKRKIGISTFFDDHKDMRKYSGANYLKYTIDDQENIYLSFNHQNKIEKYSIDGKLIFSMNRPESKLFPNKYRNKPFSVTGSYGIAVDNKGRIWVASRKKFKTNGGKEVGVGTSGDGTYVVRGDTDQVEFDHIILELFSNDGILLKIFDVNHWIDEIKIIDDKIYTLDKLRGMQYHIYDIHIDK